MDRREASGKLGKSEEEPQPDPGQGGFGRGLRPRLACATSAQEPKQPAARPSHRRGEQEGVLDELPPPQLEALRGHLGRTGWFAKMHHLPSDAYRAIPFQGAEALAPADLRSTRPPLSVTRDHQQPASCRRPPFDVDQHHTVEDVGLVLGQLFSKALGDRRGINRAGYFVLPMDETLAVVALDLGGRPALVYKDLVKVRLVGDLQTELVEDFFGGFVNHAGANLHARVMYGRSNHHKIEAIFKCFARALKYACSTDRRLKDQLPSTKGLL